LSRALTNSGASSLRAEVISTTLIQLRRGSNFYTAILILICSLLRFLTTLDFWLEAGKLLAGILILQRVTAIVIPPYEDSLAVGDTIDLRPGRGIDVHVHYGSESETPPHNCDNFGAGNPSMETWLSHSNE
jgi:hypothetical protein